MFKLFSLLFLSSCAYFVQRIDKPIIQTSANSSLESGRQNYCPLEKTSELQLIGDDRESLSLYLDLVKRFNSPLDFIDHFALYTLMQFSIRPDQTSGTSRFQIILRNEGKTHYFDFLSEDVNDQYPMIHGLNLILKKFGKKKSLEEYAKLLTPEILSKLKISKRFEEFLFNNREKIKNDPFLVPHYFRGNDILKENETVPSLDYQKMLSQYRKTVHLQKIVMNTSLIDFETERGDTGSCNYDFNLYQNSIFLIDKQIPVANLFGLSFKKSAFFASTSQKIDQFSSLDGLPLFKGISKVRSTAFCRIEKDNHLIWTLSNQSRDPGQHLFHLMRYGLPMARTASEVNKLMNHSRHLFLSDPVRLIIESNRSSKEQIDNLLKLNLPIYNADKLGNVWAFTSFLEGSRFIIDDRNNGAYLCQ